MTSSPSSSVTDLADRMLGLYLAAEPLEASLTGFREYDGELADLTRAGEHRLVTETQAIAAAALALDADRLSFQERLTRDVLVALARNTADLDVVAAREYTVAAFPVGASSILLAYVRMVVLTNSEQAEAYLRRLEAIPHYLATSLERLTAGRERGLTPVSHLVTMAIDQIDMFVSADPSPMAIAAPQEMTDVADWIARRDATLDDVVKPAFARYRDALVSDVLPSGRSEGMPGLCHLPEGIERYQALVRVHTTTNRTPDELHQIGLELVAAIHAEFSELGSRLFGISDVFAIFERLNEDPSLRWQDGQDILVAAEAAVRRAEVVARDWFGRVPEAVCALEAIPELEAEGAAPAYYLPPAVDGSRPGTYFANINRPEERTSFDLEATAFHEAVPGHHFQLSIALETPDLPMIRRVSFFNAYVEGWGLYSERLADEMGLYSSDLQRMGMLSADAWRAARLVVDTGLHAMGWTRQQAVDYMRANTSVAPIDIESEIDRYIAMPGQALSYMTGRVEIEALRRRAENALGDRFDIREFHDVVLASAALPLSILAEVVTDWITDKS